MHEYEWSYVREFIAEMVLAHQKSTKHHDIMEAAIRLVELGIPHTEAVDRAINMSTLICVHIDAKKLEG